jgi:hypothetical protein
LILSTVDPAVERRRKAEQERAGTSEGSGAWTGLLLVAASWALFGFGLGDVLQYPMGLTYLTPEMYPDNTVPGWLWALFVGAIAGLVLDIGYGAATTSRFGLAAGFSLPPAVSLIGCALGLWFGSALFWIKVPVPGAFVTAPDGRLGPAVVGGDFWIGSEGAVAAPGERFGPWDAAAWIGWTAQYWVPALLLLAGVGLALVGARQARAETRRKVRIQAVMETGVKTRGVITELHDTGVEILNQPRLRVVVKFTDHQGVDRWVTKTDNFDAVQLPRVGDPAIVWFDPANPGDEASIPVGFAAAIDVEKALAADDR